MSLVEVVRKDWECKDCGSFIWGNLRDMTPRELEAYKEWLEDDCEELIESPKNEKEWSTATLYLGDENNFNYIEANDCSISDFCDDCKKKLIEQEVFENDEDDDYD